DDDAGEKVHAGAELDAAEAQRLLRIAAEDHRARHHRGARARPRDDEAALLVAPRELGSEARAAHDLGDARLIAPGEEDPCRRPRSLEPFAGFGARAVPERERVHPAGAERLEDVQV